MGVMAMPGLTGAAGRGAVAVATRMGQLTAPNRMPTGTAPASAAPVMRKCWAMAGDAGVEPVCRDGEMPRVGFTQLSPTEVTQLGLPPGVYQRGRMVALIRSKRRRVLPTRLPI